MRSLILALLALLLAPGDAHADRATIRCTCPKAFLLPARGATNVPTNAKLWRISTWGGVHMSSVVSTADVIDVRQFERSLRSEQHFADPDLGFDFATGTARDDTPPAAPQDADVEISLHQGAWTNDVTMLRISGRYDPDTVLVRLDLHDPSGVVSLIARPEQWLLCDPHTELDGTRFTAELRAIDIAGNESAPVPVTVKTSTAPRPAARCGDQSNLERGYAVDDGVDFDNKRDDSAGPVLLWLLVVVGWVLFLLYRRSQAKRMPPEPFTLLAAEEVLCRLVRWERFWAAMLVATALCLVAMDEVLLAVLLGPAGIAALGRLFEYRWARLLLDRPDANVVRHGRWLCVTAGHDSQLFRAWRTDIEAGQRASIPRSVAR